jgi:endoglucanase
VSRSRGVFFAAVLVVALSIPAALYGDRTRASSAPISAGQTALRVQGHNLVDAEGRDVVLHGVNRMGTEYMCAQGRGIFEGPVDQASIDAMKTWNINAVRIPLNEHCWLGINGVAPEYGGAAYRDAIVAYARALIASDVYVIVDLHWSGPGDVLAVSAAPMPDADHSLAFWSDVASTFKGEDAVIFELFNEPNPDGNRDSEAAWLCWRDGGSCPGVPFEAAGMSALVRAVREAGATNVITLTGVQWGNTLSRWLEYAPSDDNLAASWHTYNWAWCVTLECYEANVGALVDDVPVIASEIGSDSCDEVWLEALMDWLDYRKVGYLAWSWSTWLASDCAASALILDYDGMPSRYGEIYRDHIVALPR